MRKSNTSPLPGRRRPGLRVTSCSRRGGQRGQAAVFVVLAMGIFLIGGVGFVVDGANLWFHRQTAQTAADAACTAGAMDMLSIAAGANLPSSASASSADTYAGFNGYSSGVDAAQLNTFSGLDGKPCNYDITDPVCDAHNLDNSPYMQVKISDPVPTTFMRLVGAGPSTTVPARSTCGLSNVLSPVPILVLNPNAPNPTSPSTFVVDAGASLTVLGGVQNSIQVNSIDPSDGTGQNAANLSSANVDLSQANGGSGGNFSVAARESQATANGGGIDFGGNGRWVSAAGVMSDPFATVSAPRTQGLTDCTLITNCVSYGADAGTFGCPPTTRCDVYSAGYYPTPQVCPGAINGQAAICVGSGRQPPGIPRAATGLAVFQPGIYYLAEDFYADSTSCLRSATGGGIGGTMFYLSGLAVLTVDPGSGGSCATSFPSVPLSSTACAGSVPTSDTVNGNVLLAPCTGPYGDPTGAGNRGILFFHDRDVQPGQPYWAGSGALVGNLYFHHCHLNPSGGSGANCDPTAFTETLQFKSGANTYVVGGIVVDQMEIDSGAHINVILSPDRQYYVLKASLLQ